MVTIILPKGSHLLSMSFLTAMYKHDAFKGLEEGSIGQWIPAGYGTLHEFTCLRSVIAEHTQMTNNYGTIPLDGLTKNILNHKIGPTTLQKEIFKLLGM